LAEEVTISISKAKLSWRHPKELKYTVVIARVTRWGDLSPNEIRGDFFSIENRPIFGDKKGNF